MPLLNQLELFKYLEQVLSAEKDLIEKWNKERKADDSFLAQTYTIAQQTLKDDDATYMVVVFKDLPSPFPETIMKKIQSYMLMKKIYCDYTFWSTYKGYHA